MIVSCYTEKYKEHALKLKKSLKELNIRHLVSEIPDQGGWDMNTKYKANFILATIANESWVVWTDADSVVRSYPSLFDELDCDVAFHRFKGQELLSGTVYFRNTEKTIELLHTWIRLNTENPKVWDQKNLDKAINTIQGLNVGKLPPEYCCIYDLSRREYKNIEPIIEHFQASRTLK